MVNIFLPISFNTCFGCSKEPSRRDGSFEYPQHMFWLRNKKNNFLLCTLNWRPGIYLELSYYKFPNIAFIFISLFCCWFCYCCCSFCFIVWLFMRGWVTVGDYSFGKIRHTSRIKSSLGWTLGALRVVLSTIKLHLFSRNWRKEN